MAEESIFLIDLENNLGAAAKALRCAWLLCKRNGMESSAKELADTVLDVETAHEQVITRRKYTQIGGSKARDEGRVKERNEK